MYLIAAAYGYHLLSCLRMVTVNLRLGIFLDALSSSIQAMTVNLRSDTFLDASSSSVQAMRYDAYIISEKYKY